MGLTTTLITSILAGLAGGVWAYFESKREREEREQDGDEWEEIRRV